MKNTGDFLTLYDASPENLRQELRQMVQRYTENKMVANYPAEAGTLAEDTGSTVQAEKRSNTPKKPRHP